MNEVRVHERPPVPGRGPRALRISEGLSHRGGCWLDWHHRGRRGRAERRSTLVGAVHPAYGRLMLLVELSVAARRTLYLNDRASGPWWR